MASDGVPSELVKRIRAYSYAYAAGVQKVELENSALREELAQCQRELAEARELIEETLACGIGYSNDKYDEVQVPHIHRKDLRAFLTKRSGT